MISRIVRLAAVEARGYDQIDIIQRRTIGILDNGEDFEFDVTMVGRSTASIGRNTPFS